MVMLNDSVYMALALYSLLNIMKRSSPAFSRKKDSVMRYSADLILLDLDVTMGYRTTYYKSTVLVSPHHAEGYAIFVAYIFCCF
jgi:hypothetical protein